MESNAGRWSTGHSSGTGVIRVLQTAAQSYLGLEIRGWEPRIVSACLPVELDSPRQRAPPSAMKPVSAGSLASPINDTQCGAALTIYALTKTGSSFVRAHFELCCAHTQVHAHIRPRSWPSS